MMKIFAAKWLLFCLDLSELQTISLMAVMVPTAKARACAYIYRLYSPAVDQ